MIFSSVFFICLFLPITIIGYFITSLKYRNLFLLVSSILFYAWGEPKTVFVMLSVIIINYFTGISIAKGYRKTGLLISIIVSLGVLVVFKYANFTYTSIIELLEALNFNTSWHALPPIILPIGISFYTFQTLSYNIDIYRKEIKPSYSLINFATYVSFFPQLVAGPIVRYKDMEEQLIKRSRNLNDVASGIERFILGLAKKVVIANNCAYIADSIFRIDPHYVSSGVAWIGIVFYTLQIYFDFSGYSDMAIGLARIFGFKFLENFNYPYISRSIKEFWRRWHISLSSWFRDYLYIPLGGSRRGNFRTYVNLFIVFFITGLWHGASLNFIIWGLWHGLFIVIERIGFDKILERMPRLLQHGYTLLIVGIGWVLFRSDNLGQAVLYVQNMFGLFTDHGDNIVFQFNDYLDVNNSLTLLLAIVFCFPVFPYFRDKLESLIGGNILVEYIYYISLLIFLIFLIATQTIATYNPFIYFKF